MRKIAALSVVMATYNGERFIEKQLESLAAQTIQPDEVLIFDDASQDNTAALVRRFIEQRELKSWSLHVNAENIGFKKNFYEAINATNGRIVFLCDQDDIWLPQKIEAMKRVFESAPGVKALNTAFQTIGSDGRTADVKTDISKVRAGNGALKKIPMDTIIRKNISPGCTMAFTEDCRAAYLQNATKEWPHDWEINIFGAMMDGLFYYNERLTQYRIHESNAIGFDHRDSDPALGRLELARLERQRISSYTGEAVKKLMGPKSGRSVERYARFADGRLAALESAGFRKWCSLLQHAKTYAQAVKLRGMLGDLMYVLKGKRHG